MNDEIRAVLNETLVAWANMLKTPVGGCLNPLDKGDCQCTVCKINKILEKEPIPIAWEYPDTHEGLDLSNIYRCYEKVLCVEQWYQDAKMGKGSLGWNAIIPVNDALVPIHQNGLYYPPFGLNWVLKRVQEFGGTMVQLRCRDEKGELCYPDYKISELLKDLQHE